MATVLTDLYGIIPIASYQVPALSSSQSLSDIVIGYIGTVAGQTVVFGCLKNGITLDSPIYIVPGGSLTANSSNYAQFTVSKVSGGVTTVIAQVDTTPSGTGNWSANTPIQIPLVGVTSYAFQSGDILLLSISQNASGVAVPASLLVVCSGERGVQP